jgi:hypothetical protein
MKTNFIWLAIVLSGFALVMLTGCRGMGTQSFTAFAPAQAHELEASSQTVLDVTCMLDSAIADYNLRENLSMLAPRPKRWKLDATLQVERVRGSPKSGRLRGPVKSSAHKNESNQ